METFGSIATMALPDSISWVLICQVEWNEKKYHFRLIFTGTKGDWPFLRSAYSLSCGYNCNDKCHRCDLREPSLFKMFL